MTIADQQAALRERVVTDALIELRIAADQRERADAEAIAAERLPRLCEDASAAALAARWRVGYLRVLRG